jgi:hypothetical protein
VTIAVITPFVYASARPVAFAGLTATNARFATRVRLFTTRFDWAILFTPVALRMNAVHADIQPILRAWKKFDA